MFNGEKIGVGVVTSQRRELFKKCINSLEKCDDIDYLAVIEDPAAGNKSGYLSEVMGESNLKNWKGFEVTSNQGVAKCKNTLLRYLLDKGCEHIFLIEDDIYIKDINVFKEYIDTSKITGIQHFNYSQHGLMNKTRTGEPNPRLIVKYSNKDIFLYPHCVGAFSYYSRKCLEQVGILDENYFNACEHVDHTYMVIKEKMHPPFWYFADISESWNYLGDEEWSITGSTISSNTNHKKIMDDADKVFMSKHNLLPTQIRDVSEPVLFQLLKKINNENGIINNHE